MKLKALGLASHTHMRIETIDISYIASDMHPIPIHSKPKYRDLRLVCRCSLQGTTKIYIILEPDICTKTLPL